MSADNHRGQDDKNVHQQAGYMRAMISSHISDHMSCKRSGSIYVKGLAFIYAELDRLEPVDGDPQTVRPLVELFYWPLGGALVLTFLLAITMLLPRYIHETHENHENHKSRKDLPLQTGGA